MTIIDVIFRIKNAKMLVLLLDEKIKRNSSTLARKEVSTFSHINRLVRVWEKDGLVTLEKKGREREITLTKKGRIVAQKIQQMMEILLNNEPQKTYSFLKIVDD